MTPYPMSSIASSMREFRSAALSASDGLLVRIKSCKGFTLIETLVAISLLTIAIVAPMSLTAQSLSSAYYARDQITAFYLAQEAIEALRSVRDANILKVSQGTAANLLDTFASTIGQPFTIDTRTNAMVLCGGTCPPLQTDATKEFYGYSASGWTDTIFTRTVTAAFIPGTINEVKITVLVQWTTPKSFQVKSFTISDNLYRWINDGSGSK